MPETTPTPRTTPTPMPDPYPRPGFTGLTPVVEPEAPAPEHSALLAPVPAGVAAVPAFAPMLEQETAPDSRTRPGACPPPAPVPGAVCGVCAHRDCRARRAAVQPVAGGHRAEFAAEHRTAALLQARHPRLIIWFGETTQSYWAATPTGLHEAADTDALLLDIRPHTRT